MSNKFSNEPIPQEWIKNYVDMLLRGAGKLEPGKMQDAILSRADYTMDLVKAWREHLSKVSEL